MSAIIPNHGARRIETISYPNKSLREAILNAFCHADYFQRSNIKIEFYDDKVKISNPGGIYNATLDEILLGKQSFRNPGIVNLFMKLDFIENYGTGLKRIQDAYKDFHIKSKFYSSENFFQVTLVDINYYKDLKENGAESGAINGAIIFKLTYIEIKALEIIKNNPNITRTELSNSLNIGTTTAYRILNKFKEINIIKRVGSNET